MFTSVYSSYYCVGIMSKYSDNTYLSNVIFYVVYLQRPVVELVTSGYLTSISEMLLGPLKATDSLWQFHWSDSRGSLQQKNWQKHFSNIPPFSLAVTSSSLESQLWWGNWHRVVASFIRNWAENESGTITRAVKTNISLNDLNKMDRRSPSLWNYYEWMRGKYFAWVFSGPCFTVWVKSIKTLSSFVLL